MNVTGDRRSKPFFPIMELKFILEALLFNTQKPLSLPEIREILTRTAEESDDSTAKALKKTKETQITEALGQLETEHAGLNRTFRLVCVAGAWQFVSQPEYAPWLKTLVGAKNRPTRLTQPALETLAIIAYRQPITRAEIEQIRGVAVDGVVATLTERGLIEQTGRAEVVGRPITYGTTHLFLEYFGLRNLEELPAADELRRLVVEKPPSLLTAEPAPITAESPAPAQGELPNLSATDAVATKTSSSSEEAPPSVVEHSPSA
jgi:segregation and condensation protein B